MIRIVLAGARDDDWRFYRQPQWMAQVREAPEAATWPRLHFDIAEDAYKLALEDWTSAESPRNREAALAVLERRGAVEVRRA